MRWQAPTGPAERLRRRVTAESGMTIAEVTIAAFILLLGILATFQMFDAATRNTYRSEQTQVGLDRAQRELEEMRALTYDEAAMISAPAAVGDQNDPRSRVSGTQFDLARDAASDPGEMVYNGSSRYPTGVVSGGVVNPGPEPFQSGDVSGDIYRFVVWRNDESCDQFACPGTQDYKELVVAIRLDQVAISYDRPYIEVHTRIADPEESVLNSEPPPGGSEVVAQQMWLSNTPCEADGSTARVVPLADNLLHNSLGTCANGIQTGAAPGAPDALLFRSPPDTDPSEPGLPEPWDYASDAYLEPDPNTDRGVQILEGASNGCSYTPSGATPYARTHRWVSDPFPSDFSVTGGAVLEFYTRAINDANHRGKLCVFLFRRTESGGSPPLATDSMLLNTVTLQPYFVYAPGGGGQWPQNAWQKIRFVMSFPPATILAGQRLGLAISVERQDTNADAIQILYEHHLYPSRLEVDTTTPLG